MKAFCTSVITPEYQDILSKHMDLTFGGSSADRVYVDEDTLIKSLQGMDVLIVSYEKITKKVLEACPDLKLISSERDGPEENIDLDAATQLGIPVVHSVGRCIHPVTEHTMMLMMALSRSLAFTLQSVRDGWWDENKPEKHEKLRYVTDHSLFEMYGKTLGIVGLGRNGMGLAQLAKGFGMKIIGYDPYVDKEKMAAQGITVMDLDDVMSQSDFVSILARVTQENEGMIGRAQIAKMKPSAFFINTGRASLVDNDALLNALQEEKIRGAALDVYDQEPLPLDHPFFKIDHNRLLLTPHQAGLSVERDASHSASMTKYILEYLSGTKPDGLYNPAVLDVPAFSERGAKLYGIERK